MQINIKTSAANQAIVSNLTQKLPGGAKENIIARVALGYSLSTGKRFKQNEFGTYDSQGKEYKEHILFDSYKDFYIALICQAYGINKNNELIPKYVKLHIDHGLEAINYLFENRPQYTFFDFLIENVEARKTMGQNGRKYLEDNWTVEKNVKILKKLEEI